MYRLSFYLVGILIISFGASVTIIADMGVGAWDALNVGLSETIGLTIGSWVIIVGIILMLINALMMKTRPDYLAFFTVLLIGSLIDFWMLVVLGNLEPTQFLGKLILLVMGLLIIGLGVGIYLQPKFPLNPIDNFMMALKERFGVSIVVAKTIGEIIALVFALIVKGPIGLGTLIVTIGIGPSIQLFYPFFEKLAHRLSVKK